jgi:HsdM N-terminal domain
VDDPAAYHAEGVLYLTPNARYDQLLALPEATDIGKAINDAIRDIEKDNPQLAGVLPKTYNLFTSTLLKELPKKVSEIPATVDYDAFGRIYEYFLGEWAGLLEKSVLIDHDTSRTRLLGTTEQSASHHLQVKAALAIDVGTRAIARMPAL